MRVNSRASSCTRRVREEAVEVAAPRSSPSSCRTPILHARTDIVLVVDVVPGQVFLRVRDGSDVAPVARRYGLDAATGRGIALVEELASAWGVIQNGDGKGSVVPDRLSDGRRHEHGHERVDVMTTNLSTGEAPQRPGRAHA